ncbi:MAG: hypothetical protein ACRD4B_04200, partial [Acidobacteriota bacterium]
MMKGNSWRSKVAEWSLIALLTVVSICLQLISEWLFFITKPSFLQNLSLQKAFLVLLSSPLVPCCIALAIIILAASLGAVVNTTKHHSIAKKVCYLIPTFFFTTSILLMFDNFTNVIFHFGIRTSPGWTRFIYAVMLALTGTFVFRRVLRWEQKSSQKTKWIPTVVAGTLTVFVVVTFA